MPNPLNARQVSSVSLNPEEIEAIIFWSKNPAPMLPHLDELDRMGFRYYWQFCLNDYPRELEPNMPPVEDRIRTFLALSQRVGPLRVVWRYDPIIISNRTPAEFHRERFTSVADRLRGATYRVMVSVVDFYQKTNRRLSKLEGRGFWFDQTAASSEEMLDLLKDLAMAASEREIKMFTCAEERDLSAIGIARGRCIDEDLINRIWSCNLRYRKDPAQRDLCLCMVSKDIGVNDSCVHGCPYCYATRDHGLAERRYREHDPRSPAIWGDVEVLRELEKQAPRQMRLLGH